MLAVLLEIQFLGLVLLGDLLARFVPFVAVYVSAFLVYLLALRIIWRNARDRQVLWLVLGAAVVFQLTGLLAEPSLSTDVHRYVWDGAVLASGNNPYTYAPADPARADFADLAVDVNHPDISTIYPPLSELAFAAAAFVAPTNRSVRGLLVLSEVLLVIGLLPFLRRRGRPLAQIALVLWCPLLVVETAMSGHLEVLPVGLLVCGLSALDGGHRNRAMWWLGAAAASKFFGLTAAVALVRRLGPLRVGGVGAILLASYVPFLDAGAGLLRGLGTYARDWHFNAPAYGILVGLLERTGSVEAFKAGIARLSRVLDHPTWVAELYYHVYPHEVARLCLSSIFASLVIWVAWRGTTALRAGAILTYAFVLLTPTLHPWYLLWALPFVLVEHSAAMLALAGLVPLAYQAAAAERAGAGWHEQPLVLFLQFVPFALLAIHDLRRRARSPGTPIASGP